MNYDNDSREDLKLRRMRVTAAAPLLIAKSVHLFKWQLFCKTITEPTIFLRGLLKLSNGPVPAYDIDL